MHRVFRFVLVAGLVSVSAWLQPRASAQADTLLNASYDISRELYREINAAFARFWRQRTGNNVEIRQSHAPSSVQARAVIDGLDADVVTLNQVSDVDALANAHRVAPDWANRFPYHASPYRSVVVFIVRSGNPKGLKNWGDLLKENVQIVLANPTTSGSGRYAFLSAYGYALQASGRDEKAAEDFMRKFYAHVSTLDAGGRGAATTFAMHQTGDVLLTFESEANLVRSELGPAQVDVIVPPVSMSVDFPVAIVEPVVQQHHTAALAQAYLDFLFSTEAQEIMGKFAYRPNDPVVAAKYKDRYERTEFIDVNQAFGGWDAVQQKFFSEGGLFDQLYRP